MTIKELAELVGDEFNNMTKEAECDSFKEMKRLYDWDAKDIRSEIDYMINRGEFSEYGIGSLDDGTVVNFRDSKDPDDECTYGEFKRMVFRTVK